MTEHVPLSVHVEEYYRLRDMAETKKAELVTLNKAKQRAEAQLIDAMVDEKSSSMKRDDGTTISLRTAFTCSVTIANNEQIREWLTERLGDDKDFVETKCSKKLVESYCKGLIEDDDSDIDIEDLPDFLNTSTRPTVSVLGWKNRVK